MNQPTPRDALILLHVARYRLTTVDVLHKLFCADITRNAVTKITSRLVSCGWLKAALIPGLGNYFILTPAGAALTGAPQRATDEFTEQSLPAAYGVLQFCVQFGVERMTPQEFHESFPELYTRSQRSTPYFRDTLACPPRLGTILIDRDNDVRRLITKVRHLITDRYRSAAFQQWIFDQRFSVTIVTSTREKCAQMEEPVRYAGEGRVLVRVAVVPELATLYPRSD